MRNVFVKLCNGDMLAARLKESTADTYTFVGMCLIVPKTQTSIGFIPYNPYGKSDEIELFSRDIMFIDDLDDSINEGFKKTYSTIITPPNQGIITS